MNNLFIEKVISTRLNFVHYKQLTGCSLHLKKTFSLTRFDWRDALDLESLLTEDEKSVR